MYTRFIRWATDRLNNKGIVAFITNSSFIDALTFDGFRKVIAEEFDYIYILDLGGNIRIGDKTGNVFNIMVGVAITFFVKKIDPPLPPLVRGEKQSFPPYQGGIKGGSEAQIYYNSLYGRTAVRPYNNAQNKLNYLAQTQFKDIPFVHIIPDKKANWINQVDNDFEELLPLIDKNVKSGKSEKAIFKLFSRGVLTQRDDWVYDFSEENLTKKVEFLINTYQQTLKDDQFKDKNNIKWDRELTNYLKRKIHKEFDKEQIISSLYRPFIKQYLYFDKHFNGMTYQWFNIYQKSQENYYLCFSGLGGSKPFQCLITDTITCLDFLEKTQCLPLYTYENGEKIDNITDWGLQQFREYYQPPLTPPWVGGEEKAPLTKGGWGDQITKLDIFHYIYAVLHNPKYREKYEQNLKRDFPRIPFYPDFNQWKNWGEKLMDLHINYETIKPYPLQVKSQKSKVKSEEFIKPKLKIDKTKGQIIIDEITTLENIPPIAWEYKLGNRSAIEWILDQYKEKKIKDETSSKHFNNYRFSDYKERVIALLQKVTTVSVETMKILKEMQ